MKLWFQGLQKVIFCVVLSTVIICFARIFFLFINVGFFENVDEVSRPWQVDPIVSIYVPPQYVRCMHDYEAVYINQALSGIGDILPDIKSHFWRFGTICIKRGGKASVSYTKHWSGRKMFHARPVPDHNGRCHDGFKKCGDGFNQQEGAICFPFDVECPITNILVQSSLRDPPAREYWETAGTFPQSNYTLFLRRQYINESPITDVTVQLTQYDAHGRNVRGVCSTGPSQTLGNKMSAANHTNTWNYDVALPPMCDTTDLRYKLVDQVPFNDHFVQNLQSRGKPRCRSICLDPSFVVRMALHNYQNVSLGLYFAREAPWSEACGVTRVALHKLHIDAKNSCAVLFMAVFVWITSLVLVHHGSWDLFAFVGIVLVFALVVGHLYFTQQVETYHDAVSSPDCTDTHTRALLQGFLSPVKTIKKTSYWILYAIGLLLLEEIVCVGWDGCMDQDDETEPPAPQTDPHVPNNDINGDTNNATNTAFAGAATQEQSVMTTSNLQNRGNRRAGY